MGTGMYWINICLRKGCKKERKNTVRISELCRLPSSHKNERKEKRKKKRGVEREGKRKEGRKKSRANFRTIMIQMLLQQKRMDELRLN